jgi:ABC-type branched-subunit amino acid transport system substrate-binding protein
VAQFGQLAALGVPVVLTASPTPTLAIYPTAAARDILVVHQGLLTSRLPATSRTLLHVRPSVATRAEALVAYARGRGAVRLGILASGDEFGRAVRAVAAARWRAWGLALVQDESVSLQTPDLGERLRRLVRLAPDALLLGLEGPDLGDVARRAREAGYPGFVLALDDDPAVALAAGPELEPAVVLAEAFVAEPGTRAERFAEAYRKKFGGPPSRWAAQGYEAVAMIADGVRAAREGRGGPVGGARLRDALVARRSFPALSGGRVVLRDDGSVVRPLGLFAASGGRLTFVRYVEGADGPAGARP